MSQSALCGGVSIDIDVAEDAEGTEVVDAANVVVVDMRQEYAIKGLEFKGHKLLANVGATVDEKSCRASLQETCRA